MVFSFKVFFAIWVSVLASISASQTMAQHPGQKPLSRVLWFNAMPDMGSEVASRHRQEMASFLDQYQDGQVFDVEYTRNVSGGALAAALRGGAYDVVIIDSANRRKRLNAEDTRALQQFYQSGRRSLMLDGSFAIRNINHNPTTDFPGRNGSSGGILVNQIAALAERGGGILIGTDHNIWQVNANAALNALVPGARFKGTTNPSTDGDFIGTTLIGGRESVKAVDLLRHWESVPNQGEAPVGTFQDFTGQQVVLYSLVETADKPGGGRKRPYVSASYFPGDNRIPIDSDEEVFDNFPTHKSGG